MRCLFLASLLALPRGATHGHDNVPAFGFYFRLPTAPFAASQVLDLDGDGARERIEVDSRRAETLYISHGRRVMWRGVWRKARPWCLRVGDVEGDGKKEIILGTFKSTRLWPRAHRTISIYSWDGRQARPRWLGSRLSQPFSQFFVANVDGDRADELLSIERSAKGRWSLAVYNWDVFGFALKTRIGSWNSVQVLAVKPNRISLKADGQALGFGEREVQSQVLAVGAR